MAVRLDTSNEFLLASSLSLSATATTFMSWVCLKGNTGAGNWQSFFDARDNTSANSIELDMDGDAGQIVAYSGGNTTNIGACPAQDAWFFIYAKLTGSGANQIEVGLWPLGGTLSTSTLTISTTNTITALRWGGNPFDTSNHRMANMKVFSEALTAAEIERERATLRPHKTSSLYLWAPALHSTLSDASKDYSGNGRNFATGGGTPTIEDGPPIPYGARSSLISAVPSSGIAGTLSATLGAFTLAATGALTLVGSATPTLGAFTLSSTARLAMAGAAAPTLGAFTLSSAGAVALKADLAQTLGAFALSATGTFSVTGALSATLDPFALSSAGSLALKGNLAVTLGALTLSAAGVNASPITGALNYILEPFTLSASGGFGIIAPPLVGLSLTASPLSATVIIAPPL